MDALLKRVGADIIDQKGPTQVIIFIFKDFHIFDYQIYIIAFI